MAGTDTNKITRENFEREILFNPSRSSGPGGQHVNKVSTKIELRFHIPNSELLTEEEKVILLQKLKNKINKDGELIIISQEERSQIKNKEAAIKKFLKILKEALTPIKERKATKPTRASLEKRLEEKRLVSEKKSQRKKPEME
jgi:ribosome-associated protein